KSSRRPRCFRPTELPADDSGYRRIGLIDVLEATTALGAARSSQRLPRIAVLRDGPAEHLGRDTMPAGLRRLVAELLSFYLEAFPIAASVFSDPELLTRHREALRERGAGPHTVAEGVAAYLAAEQQAGRLAPTARPDVMAELLVGACLHRAFLVRFAGRTATPDHIRRFAEDVVKALEPALTT
ncbi:MAG: hypothetical protein ACRDSO_11955, partial [Pseudonocardiaceae bacterium]